MSNPLGHKFFRQAAASLCGFAVIGCSWFSKPNQPTGKAPPSLPAAPSQPTQGEDGTETSPEISSDQTESTAETPASETSSSSTEKPPESQPPAPELSKKEKQLVSQTANKVQKQGNIARQDSGKTVLDNILVLQKTERLVGGTFVPSIAALSEDIPEEITEYQFQVLEASQKQTVVTAIAKVPGLSSYVGAAYNVENSTPISGICRSNEPAQAAPAAPTLVSGTIRCASGSTAIE